MLWAAFLFLMLAPAAEGPSGSAGQWSFPDLVRLSGELRSVQSLSDPKARDQALAALAGTMYGLGISPNEAPQTFSKRLLQQVGSDLPSVKEGQELDAVLMRLYSDVAARARQLARFERDRQRRQFLMQLEAGAQQAVAQIAPTLQFQVDGFDGFFEPLPRSTGEPPSRLGVKVMVHGGGSIRVEQLDRVHFQNHRPPADVRRSGGAIHELMAAQKQYNISARLLGRYEPSWNENKGHVQLAVPQNYPSIYLNETIRAARNAGMHTLHLLVTGPRGKLREISGKLTKSGPGLPIHCEDELIMQACVQRVRHASLQGAFRFSAEGQASDPAGR